MTDQKRLIEEKPTLPPGIINAVKSKKLAIFFGAGVSRLIGCDGWDQLAHNLIEICFSTKKANGETLINYKEKDTISRYTDNKKIISICFGILKQNKHEDLFYKKLEKSLNHDDKLLEKQNIYKELYDLLLDNTGFRGVFITTNADKYFSAQFFKLLDIAYDNFNPMNDVNQYQLYHIHGLIPFWDSLVFTINQYIQRYHNKNFVEVLKKIFSEYTVLFIGYGMSEFELLDFLITKKNQNIDSNQQIKDLKHFILLPYYRGEDNILKFDELYYKDLGINVIGYEKDKKGYNQLYDVIKDWNEQLSNVLSNIYNKYKRIDDAVTEVESIGREPKTDN